MTFTDAAIEVLRLVGKPLHYKEITDIAIERNLLSHVGKSPEVTMGARLAALMKKETGDNPLIRVKPGVFGLKDWDASKMKAGSAGGKAGGAKKSKAGDVEEHAVETEVEDAEPSSDEDEVLVDLDVDDEPDASDVVVPPPVPTPVPQPAGRQAPRRREPSPEDVEQGPDDQMRAEAVLGAGEMFDEEEDDDEPILGGADDANRAPGEAGADGRRRRRRRRRGRGPEVTPSEGGLPAYTATPVEARAEAAPREAREGAAREGGGREGGGREGREPREGAREPREGWGRGGERGADRGGERGADRGGDRAERERGEALGREAREGRGPQILELVGSDQIAGEDLSGRDMADVVATLLGTFDRNGGPVSLRHLAETLQRKGKGGGDVQLLSSQIAAAIRADNARRAASGARPRFRFAGGRVGSTDWILGGDLLLAERDAVMAVERYREAARRAFARRVSELPGHAFVELVVLALERFGIGALRSVRRPGGAGNEAHFAGKLRGPGDDFAVGIVVRRDGREIGRERVTELRGALHHYGNAQSGFLFTSGQILSGAREEAASTGVAPVALHDGTSFARLCEDHEVAVIKSKLAIAIPDVDLLEALRAS